MEQMLQASLKELKLREIIILQCNQISKPEFRMKPSPPFSRVGVDFAGLLFVKAKNGQMRKVYMTLFSSCATRAVDLEAMSQIVYSQKRNTSINGVR